MRENGGEAGIIKGFPSICCHCYYGTQDMYWEFSSFSKGILLTSMTGNPALVLLIFLDASALDCMEAPCSYRFTAFTQTESHLWPERRDKKSNLSVCYLIIKCQLRVLAKIPSYLLGGWWVRSQDPPYRFLSWWKFASCRASTGRSERPHRSGWLYAPLGWAQPSSPSPPPWTC